MKRYKEWNRLKKKNDFWIDRNDWINKAWQEVIHDNKTHRIALNEIRSDKLQASTEISKYVSKAKSKASGKYRWYSFSNGFRGVRPELKTMGATYMPARYLYFDLSDFEESEWELCYETKDGCSCERPVIAWDFRDKRNVFINIELIKILKESSRGVFGGHFKPVQLSATGT